MTMKRWEMTGYGREALRLMEVERPQPGPGEVLVKVEAASLNYRDTLIIENGMGMPLAFPLVPASDLAGTVVGLGAGVTRFGEGDRVLSTFFPGWIDGRAPGNAKVLDGRALGGSYPGVLTEYVALPADWLVAAPGSLDLGEASTLPCAGLTAWFALTEAGSLEAGDTVLVQGTGGVALFALQIAKARGARVVVTSGSPDKLERALALGADDGIDRTQEEWVEAVHRLTNDRGIDHILELVGGPHLGRSLEAVAVGGRISVIGVFEGFDISGSAGPLLMKNATIQGIRVGHRRALEDLVRAVDETGLKPVIDRRYGLADLPAALDHLQRGPFGKIVVEMN
ncbi:alcohol dehydrogenase [Aureimonas ureilytica]|uniref:Alcohol dehydrogenase n=2 Tax=Aureimonas ureilytica TaxID=401562 RepID=A0A175RB29_9HYPH|nr:alcohol dehydrogenase [Aureimonas ureilytica]